MTNNKRHSLIVKIRRPSKNVPWGISIAGGSDLGTPLVVTRSENEDLQKGDVIKKIDEYDVRDLRHVDAQKLLQNSDSVKLAIERSDMPCIKINQSSSRKSITINNTESSATRTTITVDNNHTKLTLQSISKPTITTQMPPMLPKSPLPMYPANDEFTEVTRKNSSSRNSCYDDSNREEKYILAQPYRTTPLVLPGAKVKKDAPLGECYLRHHPNPMVRAPPHHYDPINPDVAMKQKVVHKQFNSPIGLYSEQNIADTLKCQASAIPIFIDFSFLKQKQEIEEQARRMKEQAKAAAAKNVWPQFNRPI